MHLPHVTAFARNLADLARTFGLSPPSPPPPHPWTKSGLTRQEWRNRRAENVCPRHNVAFRLRTPSLAGCPVATCDQTKRVSL